MFCIQNTETIQWTNLYLGRSTESIKSRMWIKSKKSIKSRKCLKPRKSIKSSNKKHYKVKKLKINKIRWQIQLRQQSEQSHKLRTRQESKKKSSSSFNCCILYFVCFILYFNRLSLLMKCYLYCLGAGLGYF